MTPSTFTQWGGISVTCGSLNEYVLNESGQMLIWSRHNNNYSWPSSHWTELPSKVTSLSCTRRVGGGNYSRIPSALFHDSRWDNECPSVSVLSPWNYRRVANETKTPQSCRWVLIGNIFFFSHSRLCFAKLSSVRQSWGWGWFVDCRSIVRCWTSEYSEESHSLTDWVTSPIIPWEKL